MRVLLATTGSHGDVHPYLGIGQALQQRGHDVQVFTNPHFRAAVGRAGLEFRPIAEDVDLQGTLDAVGHESPKRRGQRVLRLLLDAIPAVVQPLRSAIARDRPDVVLAHNICFGARWVCEELGAPHALGVVSPQFWLSSTALVPAPQKRPGAVRERCGRWLTRMYRRLLPMTMDVYFNRLRRRHGFPTQKHAYARDFMGGERCLALWSTHFRPPTAEDPPQGIPCGFVWYDRGTAENRLPPVVGSFLDGGTPPLVFTLGTATARSSPQLFETALTICRRLGRRGLLLTGKKETGEQWLSPEVLATTYAPYSQVFPRAAAVVHHAGMGTIALAVRAGCPAVVVPQAYDQFNNAVYAVKHGVATWLDRLHIAEGPLIAALRPVLEDPAYRARTAELGERIGQEDGAQGAVAALENLARGVNVSSRSAEQKIIAKTSEYP